jgi:hypothetical protein
MSILETHQAPVGAGADPCGETSFEVVLSDGTHELVQGADAYQQEQSMTTFFRTDGRRQRVDCWSVRVASFRTDQLMAVRRLETGADPARHLRSV